LIEFPLSEKLIEKNLFFLLKNLEFEESSGRELISEILLKILDKFPVEVLEHYVDFFQKALRKLSHFPLFYRMKRFL